MKRRSFSSHALGLTALSLGHGRSADANQVNTVKPGISTLAGMSLGELAKRYRADLFGKFLPFMDTHIIDHDMGGFMCNAKPDGTLISSNKRAGYDGRGLWIYSCLYNNLAPERRYLDVAAKTAALLLKNKPDGYIMWPSSYEREGNPAAPSSSVNADMYIAEGFAEFAAASGDNTFRELSKEVALKCLRVYDRPDYGINAGRGYLGKDAPETPGIRIMDDWMLFLRFATRFLMHGADDEIEKLAARCVDTIMNRFYNPTFGLITEMLDHEHSPYENELGQLINFGNAFQALWHVMDEAVRVRNRTLFEVVSGRLHRHIEVASDDVYGGVFNLLKHVDNNTWSLNKTHYAHVEILVGLLMIIEHTCSSSACDTFDKIYRYVEGKFPKKQYGFPLWIRRRPFHHIPGKYLTYR